jgi:hypothetical protein
VDEKLIFGFISVEIQWVIRYSLFYQFFSQQHAVFFLRYPFVRKKFSRFTENWWKAASAPGFEKRYKEE